MVMGFQDEIDDEDYLRPSQLSYPVTQISDSSEDELDIPQPNRTASAYTVSQTLDDLKIEDDLDDWLNGSSEQSSSSKQKSGVATASAAIVKSDEITISRSNVETVVFENSAEETTMEVTGKSSKKTKEKKSKRKSKKSSKETGRSSNSSLVESDAIEPPRPHEEYEEI